MHLRTRSNVTYRDGAVLQLREDDLQDLREVVVEVLLAPELGVHLLQLVVGEGYYGSWALVHVSWIRNY